MVRNACEIEKPTKEFGPMIYYQHVHANKQLFFVLEPTKLGFLGGFKNDFLEIFLSEDKVEVKLPSYVSDDSLYIAVWIEQSAEVQLAPSLLLQNIQSP